MKYFCYSLTVNHAEKEFEKLSANRIQAGIANTSGTSGTMRAPLRHCGTCWAVI